MIVPRASYLLAIVLAAMGFIKGSAMSLSNSQYNPEATKVAKSKTGISKHKMPRVETVVLGEDMAVDIYVPPDDQNRQRSKTISRGMKISTSDPAGDVIWPSSFALARLVAHCPAVVKNRNVLELGCGLGLPSAAACLFSKPNHVALSDCDSSVLGLGYKSCTELQRSRASVSRCTMDWKDESTWPNQSYDLLLGSDLLYDRNSLLPLANVLQFYLSGDDKDDNPRRALIVDPLMQTNRAAFSYAAYRAGLEVDEMGFPGMSEFVLLDIRSRDR